MSQNISENRKTNCHPPKRGGDRARRPGKLHSSIKFIFPAEVVGRFARAKIDQIWKICKKIAILKFAGPPTRWWEIQKTPGAKYLTPRQTMDRVIFVWKWLKIRKGNERLTSTVNGGRAASLGRKEKLTVRNNLAESKQWKFLLNVLVFLQEEMYYLIYFIF